MFPSQWIVFVLLNDLENLLKVIIATLLVALPHLVGYHVPDERVWVERWKLVDIFHVPHEVVAGLSDLILNRINHII